MIRSVLIGLVAGQRGMAPLAALAGAAQRGAVDRSMPLAALFEMPGIAGGAIAMAAAEMAGDKMKSAPDRIVTIGLAVRSVTAAYAGASLATPGRRVVGGALAVATALASSYVGWRIRCASLHRYGRTASGFVEDAIVIGVGLAVADPRLVRG